MPNFEVVSVLALCEFDEHRFRIDAAHQLADVLALTYLGAVRRQAAQVPEGHKKGVGQA